MSDDWRDSYDAWKLASPDDDGDDEWERNLEEHQREEYEMARAEEEHDWLCEEYGPYAATGEILRRSK